MKSFTQTTDREKCAFSVNAGIEMNIIRCLSETHSFPLKANPGLRLSDNATIETSRHCDMCFGSPAIEVVHSKVPPAPPQSPLQFT